MTERAIERKVLVLDSDRISPHPVVSICQEAKKLRDEILRIEDLENGRIVFGRVSRQISMFSGCLIEIIPWKEKSSF